MRRRGWDAVDVVLVTGDAYVDHPAFGVALVGRLLEDAGYRVAVLARPDWRSPDAFRRFGRPRLCFGITGGNLDSLVANRNAWRSPRPKDHYAPGGTPGGRPDRACLVYAGRCREAWPDVPLLLGGLEASLRRLAHYDWWSDKVRRSLLADARADLLVYGMGERALLTAVERLDRGESLAGIPGTARLVPTADAPQGRELPGFEAVRDDPDAFLAAQNLLEGEQRAGGATLLQAAGAPNRVVVQEPPAAPPGTGNMDRWAALPFTRRAHPDYDAQGGVPALDLVKDSVIAHRGCLGDCSFCALTVHQGRWISSRSPASVEAEVRALLADPALKGRISDVGGPSANMFGLGCPKLERGQPCRDKACLVPRPCPALQGADSGPWLALLRRLRALPGLRKLTVGSGPRYDLLDREGLVELCRHHVAGQLKVAPEHCGRESLRCMHKPDWQGYEAFARLYGEVNRELGREQYLSNYFLVAHPGTTLAEAVELFDRLSRWGHSPEQVQVFMPIPLTRGAAMYRTGRDPRDGRELYVARDDRERRMHLALAQWRLPAHREPILQALKKTGRRELASRLGRKRRK